MDALFTLVSTRCFVLTDSDMPSCNLFGASKTSTTAAGQDSDLKQAVRLAYLSGETLSKEMFLKVEATNASFAVFLGTRESALWDSNLHGPDGFIVYPKGGEANYKKWRAIVNKMD